MIITFTKKKSRLHESSIWVPDCSDIILIDCSSLVEKEAFDVKPFVVLSQRDFNERTSLVAGFPIIFSGKVCNDQTVQFKANHNLVNCALGMRLKLLNWRLRCAVPFSFKKINDTLFIKVCAVLNKTFYMNSGQGPGCVRL